MRQCHLEVAGLCGGGLHAHFVSLNKFEAQVDQPGQTPFVLHMKFEHWGWKITRFDLPQSAPRP
ncbi:hypothetical protein [Gluconobacter japonicus]|uniref:hypothetical protein n=1 Tax=Gluconobacter japonicus TaxID=376620 RepID=UPI001E5BF7CF|nr:hypothetical protein [Gluconobacter japonicus]